jgi:hypothetical protein
MKIANKYFKPLSLLFALALMVASCTEFQEFESTTYGPGPTISLSQVSVQDSTFTISVTSSANGSASVILLPGSGNAAPADPEDLATGNVNAMDYQSKHVVANTATNFTFNGLVQNATFEVMAVGTNLDGKYSDVATLAVGTDDTHAPMLVSTSPAVGYSPVLAIDGSVVLVFDEPVVYDDTKDLVFSEFYDGVDVVAGSVTVDFNEVTVTFGEDLTNRDYVMLSYPEGAFADHSGNLAEGMESYFDGAGLVGLYWRAEAKDFEPLSVTPEEAVVPAGFDIVLTFAEEVDADDVADGDITLTYDDGMDILIKSVLASEVSAAGNELTITQSYIAAPGVVVTLNIPAELLGIGYGNPNAEVTASWSILHPLQAWIGTYDVESVSYSHPGDWDEAWTVTTAAVAGDLTKLSITIDAGSGGGTPFMASVNDGAMTISIPAGSVAGDLYGYGPTAIYYGDDVTFDEFASIDGTIEADGTINLDKVTMILTDYGFVDGYWDAFNTTWTKSAKKAATIGSVPASKADRFK